MTIFDYGALIVLLVSGLAGFVRGATREVSTGVALVLSAIAAVATIPFTEPLARHFIATEWMAKTAAILLMFIITYIALRLMGDALTRGVQQTSLSGLDRILGFGIGMVRALVVLGGFVLLVNAATPPDRMPGWITTAKLYPLAAASGDTLRAFAPQGMKVAREVAPGLGQVVQGENPKSETDQPDAPDVRPRAQRHGPKRRPEPGETVEDMR